MINKSSFNYKKTYEFILLLIAVMLPFTEYFSTQFISIAIILLLANWLFLHDHKTGLKKLNDNKIIFILIGVYLININGLFRETGADITGKILVKKLSLFILPVIIGTSPEINYNRIKLILVAFITSLLISTLFTYSEGVTYLLKLQDDITDVANVLIMHRPYYGLLGAFAVLALLLFLLKKQHFLTRIGLSLLIVYFCVFLAIIYAKMAFIAVLISIICLVFCWLAFLKKYFYLLVCFILMIVAVVTTYQLKPSLQNYVSTILEGKDFSFTEYNVVLVGSINTRYVNWGCAYGILKENGNWLYGVGPGNSQNMLQDCYKVRNEWIYQSKMNAHNQFIEEILHNGMVGFILFAGSIFLAFIVAFKRKDFLYLSFLLVFTLCCLTESVLGRQIGIIFYAFFNSLLLFNCNRQTTVVKI